MREEAMSISNSSCEKVAMYFANKSPSPEKGAKSKTKRTLIFYLVQYLVNLYL